MSTLSNWASTTPELLFALGLITIPGLAVGRALGFKWSDAAGLSPALGLGVLAVADEVASHGKRHWGLPVIAITTVVVVIGCWLGASAFHRWAPRAWNVSRSVDTTPVWNSVQRRIACVTTLLAMAIGGYAIARGMGGPHGLIQVWDGDFHLNSIVAMVSQHSASPSVPSQMAAPGGSSTFYPPMFAGCAALVVTYFHVGPVVAANVTALAIAMLWPVAMSILVRHAVRVTTVGYGAAMLGAATITVFPALLLSWGVLWPNALSFLALPGVIVALVHAMRLDVNGRSCDARTAAVPGLLSCCLAVVLGLAGMTFAHPGAVFIVFYVGVVLAVWFGWRHLVSPRQTLRNRTLAFGGLVLTTGVTLAVAFAGADSFGPLKPSLNFYWQPRESWGQAVGEVVTLAGKPATGNLAMGLLMVAGLVLAAKRAQTRWLAVCLGLFAVLSVFAAAVQTDVTRQFTGFWYSDSRRMYAILPLFALPLIALGADQVRRAIADGITGLSAPMDERWRSRIRRSATVASVSGVAILILLFQGGPGTASVSQTLSKFGYNDKGGFQIKPAQVRLFASLRHELPPGSMLAGNPFAGTGMAAVLSGHQAVFPILTNAFAIAPSPDRRLLQTSFNQFMHDQQVCAAVKRLNVAAVINDTGGYSSDSAARLYPGFEDLESTPGLTVIGRAGGVTIYRVGACEG